MSYFSPEKLFSKISDVAKKAGVKVIYAALLLYYAMFDKEVPMSDKAIVVGALGYFILPLDFIPDFLPGGFVDDAGALVLAVKNIWSNISANTHRQAKAKLNEWFDNINPSDLQLF
ncbi:MAG: DUF1232 domain-containing protein [Bacteroides sp.]|nr:DUF1232 domain-containing protein [Barnesiella sp.]MBD5368954.1 DUF1232 domain-containing protein [Bacteroides sp.]